MACSGASLGLLYLRILLLLLIPRVAGSMRTIRLFASDFDVPLPLNQTRSGNSSSAFLSTTSPGFFLDLKSFRDTSLIRVYGHKHAGASLYGVRLAPGGGQFHTVDGHDPSISTSPEWVPSCLFSLALDQWDDRHLELHNLYDSRFGTFGEITLSFVEYVLGDDGSTIPIQNCACHLRPSSENSALLRRDTPTSSSSPTQNNPPSGSPVSSPHTGLSSRMNIVIGLIAALITIVVVIFFVAVVYMLRRQRVLPRFPQDPEATRDRPISPQKSTTLGSATATETTQFPRDKLGSDPTSSHVENTKVSYKADTSSVTSAMSRPRSRNDPPTSPPKEPVPELPKLPVPLPSNRAVRSRDIVPEALTSASPLIYRKQKTPQGTQHGTRGVMSPSSERIDLITPARPGPAHIRDQSSSESSMSSHEVHPRSTPSKPRSRFSKPLPDPLPETFPFTPTSPSQISTRPSRSSQDSNERLQRTDPGSRLVNVRGAMRTIRESSPGSDSSHASPHVPVPPYRITPGRTRSAEKVQEGAPSQPLTRARNPRESKSSPEFEIPLLTNDIRWKGVTQPIGLHDREALNSRRTQPLPSQRKGVRQGTGDDRTRLSLKIPADPEDWLSPSSIMPLNSVMENKSRTETRQATRLYDSDVSPQRGRQGESRKAELGQYQLPTKTVGPHLAPQSISSQPPRYEETALLPKQSLSIRPPVITSLSPHRRALPKTPV